MARASHSDDVRAFPKPSTSCPWLGEIRIRPAYGDDHEDLHRLAALDSAERVPDGSLLVAELDGRLAAALSRKDGTVIADPFQRTTELIELLRTVSARGL